MFRSHMPKSSFRLAFAAVVTACSTDRAVRPNKDAGRLDASVADAPTDALVIPDAPTTGGPIGADWTALPGLPSSCSLRMSPNPSVEVSAFQWASCGSGRTGCHVLQPDWAGWLGFPPFESPRLVNGSPVLLHYRTYANSVLSPTAVVGVVAPLNGTPIFAFGQVFSASESCTATGGVGDYGFALNVVSSSNNTYSHFLELAPWATPLSLASRTLVMADFGLTDASSLVQLSVGSQYAWLQTSGYITIGAVPFAGGPPIYPAQPNRPSAIRPQPVADGAIAFDQGAKGNAVDLVRFDGSYSVLLSPDSTHVLTALNVDRANSNAIVWVLCDTTLMNCVVSQSPYATSSSALQPKQIARLRDTTGNGGHFMAVNANTVLAIIDTTTLQVTRLTDGLGWQVKAEPGLNFGTALWVDDNEIWATMSDPKITNKETSIIRVARSSLGAPTLTAF